MFVETMDFNMDKAFSLVAVSDTIGPNLMP